MRRIFLFVIILLSLIGCTRADRTEPITATVIPDYEENDKNVTPTQRATLEQDVSKETYLDSIVQKVTPYSIFDTGEDIAEGDVVIMGSYAHGQNDYGGYPYLPVQWLVLEKRGTEALLLSLYNVDVQPFFEQGYTEGAVLPETVSWENSTLRNWLNETFMLSAFLKTQRDCIKKAEIQTQSNSFYGTNGVSKTQDFLFLLSEEEVKRYFDTEAMRITNTVPKVEQGYGFSGSKSSEDNSAGWWLRTPGKDAKSAAFVHQTGEVVSDGAYVESLHIAVRPAMWVDLEKMEQVSETLSAVHELNQEENLTKSEEEYRKTLNALWEQNEGEKSTAMIKAVEISLETVRGNSLYDSSTVTLPISAECIDKVREIGKQWSWCEEKNFLQQRVSLALYKYGGEIRTEFIEYEQYWEIPRSENQYIPRNFTIGRIVGTNQICEVKWQGHVQNEEERAELLRQVNCVVAMMGDELLVVPDEDSFYYDGKTFHISVSQSTLLDSNEMGEYYYVRIY